MVGIRGKNSPSEGMSTVFRNTNNVTHGLPRIRGEAIIYLFIVDLLPEMKAKEGTNINGHTSEMVEGNSTDIPIVSMVQ